MEVRTGSVRRPCRTGGPGPTGDDPAAANDRVLAVSSLPDGVAVLRAKDHCLGKKIRSRANRNGDGARDARATLCAGCITGFCQGSDRAVGRDSDDLARQSNDNEEQSHGQTCEHHRYSLEKTYELALSTFHLIERAQACGTRFDTGHEHSPLDVDLRETCQK